MTTSRKWLSWSGVLAGGGAPARCGRALGWLRGKEPRLYAGAAAQRVHVKNGQMLGQEIAKLAAVEGQEDGTGEGQLDGASLEHVHAVIGDGALLGAAASAVPFPCTGGQQCQRVLRHHLIVEPALLSRDLRDGRNLAQPARIKAPLPSGRVYLGKISAEIRSQMPVESCVRVRKDQVERGARRVRLCHSI